ncbi:hypothetical protein KI688_009139 [Linnemannia hyalina]|uniref:Uncharacterized protein n=1 Tax=Linnemannia hyalina TaxID=64524 RepID=A0A9P7XYG2_9FUNG|nr:hypothetical protein KI688_009139 [Linnemannia hyalina]
MGMGDGIINQSMKEDLDSKPTESRRFAAHIPYFLSNEADTFLFSPHRPGPMPHALDWITALGLTPGLPVHVVGFFGHCRDLSMFERVTPAVRRKDGTYETSSCIGSFEDDERMPRQMLQELDRFMAICWDRIGVPPPDHERSQSDNGGGGGRGSNPLANILTPGRCVPVLIFVIERVPIVAPWHEAGASENQIVELPEALLDYSDDNGNETLDPAAAVLRQRLMTTTGGSQSSKKQGSNAKFQPNKSQREKAAARPTADESNRALGNPTLREIYDAVVQARDQPLSGTTGAGGRSAAEGTSQLSLGNESISIKLQNVNIAGGGANGNSHGNGVVGGEAVRERGPRRGGKKYSLRCAHLVQKKIQDFVQTDEVMEEL